jgi:hypothetical protein
MNSLGVLILLHTLLGAPEVLALDNGAIRIEIEPELFAVRFIGRPGGENFLDPIYVRDTVRNSEGVAESGGLTTIVEPLGLRAAVLSRGPARLIDSGPYHVVLIGPVAEESGLRIRKDFRIDPKEPKAWYTVTVLSLNKEPVELSVVNSAAIPMGTTVWAREPEGASIRALEDDLGALQVEKVGGGVSFLPRSLRVAGRKGRWGGSAGGAAFKNSTGIWVRKIDGPLADTQAYNDEAPLVFSINDTAMRYGVDMRSPRTSVDSATPLIHREIWQLEEPAIESETKE